MSQVSSLLTTQVNYTDPTVNILCFKLSNTATNVTDNYLIYFENKGKYLSALIKNETLNGGYAHVVCADVYGTAYQDFQVNSSSKFGKYVVTRNVPFESIGIVYGGGSTARTNYMPLPNPNPTPPPSTQTCMQQNHNFGDCMKCAIKECNDDWLCGVVCGINFPLCAATWMAACAIG